MEYTEIKIMLLERMELKDMIVKVKSDEGDFTKLVSIMFSDNNRVSWKASWLLGHCMAEKDKRLSKYSLEIIKLIKIKEDSQQRELLRIVEKLEIGEDIEGLLFDVCSDIWISIHKSSSVRIIAFRILVPIAIKYPELKREVFMMSENKYSESLSDGIKKSFDKLVLTII